MAKRIVIMAGGTGGHVFPALAVAQSLMEKGWHVSWLGTQKGLESKVVPEHGIDIDWLAVAGVRGKGVWAKISAIGMLSKAAWQARAVLKQRQPHIVLGMGGFVAGPGGLMAKLMGIPLIIHEQNRVPGTTNRLLARFADQVLEAFPNSFKQSLKATCTGNPLRKAFLTAEKHVVHGHKTTTNLLIFGGSQGAKILNDTVPQALANIPDIQVIHQTGTAMFEQVRSHYRDLGIKSHVTAFIDDMVAAYQWADIVVCRAGAMTVSEVAAMGVAAIFVPLPNAIDDHQVANARYLTDADAGLMLQQKDLSPNMLASAIQMALHKLDTLRHNAKRCARLDATETVTAYCIAKAN